MAPFYDAGHGEQAELTKGPGLIGVSFSLCHCASAVEASGSRRAVSGGDDARASKESRAVGVKELGDRAWGAAGDLLESAGGVVVLAGEDRPLAGDEQFSRPGRYPGAGEALEELPLGRDPEGDGLAEFG